MLEQQHIWLVAGLQQLYRRALNGQGWPSGLLRCQANGHPLTHDLLTCLGVLDQSKGEGFEVDALVMYHELCNQDAPASAQHQECSDFSSDSAHLLSLACRFVNPLAQQMTIPPSKHSPGTSVRSQSGLSTSFGGPQLPMTGVVNPVVLQEPLSPQQQWSDSEYCRLEQIEVTGLSDFENVLSEDDVLQKSKGVVNNNGPDVTSMRLPYV
ncbi:hypothetical protein CNMCM6069_005406 [Aspergillus lentulus]|nr:hypothetical protein CNMCM6069_005406 [Aspergillus lentulus]